MLFVCECFHVTTLLYALQNSATDPPYHPTVSDISSLTEKVLEFVGYHLQPLPINLSSYLKDTTDLWNKLKVIQNADENDWFVTLDESSLPLRHLCRGLIYNALEALYSQQNTTIYIPFDLIIFTEFIQHIIAFRLRMITICNYKAWPWEFHYHLGQPIHDFEQDFLYNNPFTHLIKFWVRYTYNCTRREN